MKFGNSTAVLIEDLKLKKTIINSLFQLIPIKNLKFQFLKDSNVSFLVNKDHYLVFNTYDVVNNNFVGRCILFFTKIKERYCSFLIDRTTLKYDLHHTDYAKVKIVSVKYRVSPGFYNNTILDGNLVFLRSSKKWIYRIIDIYYAFGNIKLKESIKDKHDEFVEILEREYKKDKMEVAPLKLAKLFNYKGFSRKALIRLIQSELYNNRYHCNGLLFVPDLSGIWFLYKENQEEIIKKLNNPEQASEKKLILEFKKNPPNKTVTFLMKKHEDIDMPDIFLLFLRLEKELVKMGYACCNTIRDSVRINKYFQDREKVLVDCEFFEKFQKWRPIILSDKKEPDKINS